MNKKRNKRKLLRLLSIGFLAAGALTLIPNAHTAETSILGYHALCSFAPVSTLLTLYVGVTIHRYLANVREE